MNECPICDSKEIDYRQKRTGETTYDCSCPRCGLFSIGELVLQHTVAGSINREYGPPHLISGAIRNLNSRDENGRVTLTHQSMQNLLDAVAVPEDPLDQIDLLLEHIVRKSDSPRSFFELTPATDYPLIFAKDPDEFIYCYEKAQELYLETDPLGAEPGYRVSTEGWKRLREIKQTRAKSNQAFVAMWFNDETDDAWEEGIRPALKKDLKLSPLRIDMKEHNEKICDHIISEIRKSGLLVADVTGHRQGVYFEAGFAMGLGIPVVWMCRADQIKVAPFDTRQYNHITWEEPEDLREQLVRRIEATLPHLSSMQSPSPPPSRQH